MFCSLKDKGKQISSSANIEHEYIKDLKSLREKLKNQKDRRSKELLKECEEELEKVLKKEIKKEKDKKIIEKVTQGW